MHLQIIQNESKRLRLPLQPCGMAVMGLRAIGNVKVNVPPKDQEFKCKTQISENTNPSTPLRFFK